MKQKISNATKTDLTLIIVLVLLTVIITLQDYFLGMRDIAGGEYTYYNNYLIFKNSFLNLIQENNLFVHYPELYFDLYKYSPTFSLFFGLFYYLPDWIGLLLWNGLNISVLYLAVKTLPKISQYQKYGLFLFVLFELITSVQNEQSNLLMAALIVLMFNNLETNKYWKAALFIVSSIFIKLFGIVALCLALFYPKKIKLSFYLFAWAVVLFILPIVVIKFEFLLTSYENWLDLLKNDHSVGEGISVMGWLKSWFSLDVNKMVLTLIGMVLFSIPLLRIKQYKSYLFRITILASVLIWVVIFNHMAESPTYIIAVVGVIIWYMFNKKSKVNLILVISVFILTTLSATDIFPPFVRENFVKPYTLKAFPVILVWAKILFDLLTIDYNKVSTDNLKS
jgi:hypothetical protein